MMAHICPLSIAEWAMTTARDNMHTTRDDTKFQISHLSFHFAIIYGIGPHASGGQIKFNLCLWNNETIAPCYNVPPPTVEFAALAHGV